MALLKLPGSARILDVACGGGWFSHWLMRLGYSTYGVDIASDFVDLARRRVREDSLLNLSAAAAEGAFDTHDIEAAPLPHSMAASFDAAVLESCLHHFVDPVAALTHTAQALKEDGLVVIIEGENRTGPIRQEYMSVMRELDTLERPYKREHLIEALNISGLPEVEFVGPVPGWMSLGDPLHPHLTEHHRNIVHSMNLCVAGKHKDALRRIFTWRA